MMRQQHQHYEGRRGRSNDEDHSSFDDAEEERVQGRHNNMYDTEQGRVVGHHHLYDDHHPGETSSSASPSRGEVVAMRRRTSLDRQFEEFLQQEADNAAFAAYHHHYNQDDDPEQQQQPVNIDDVIHASDDDQTIVSEITTFTSASLFRGPLYQRPTTTLMQMDADLEDEEIANLFNRSTTTSRNSSHHHGARSTETAEEAVSIIPPSTPSNSTPPINNRHNRHNHHISNSSRSRSSLSSFLPSTTTTTNVSSERIQDYNKSTKLNNDNNNNNNNHGTAGRRRSDLYCLQEEIIQEEDDSDNTGNNIKQKKEQKQLMATATATIQQQPGAYHSSSGAGGGSNSTATQDDYYGEAPIQIPNYRNTLGLGGGGTTNTTNTNTTTINKNQDKQNKEGENNNNNKKELSSRRRWRIIAGAAILLIVVVVLSIVFVVVLPQDDDDNNSHKQEVGLEGNQHQQQGINNGDNDTKQYYEVIPNLTQSTIQAIEGDKFSPQFQAYDWVSRDPNWDTYDDWRKQQRFALVCIYYSIVPLTGVPASQPIVPSYYNNECDDWIRGGRSYCNDMGQMTLFTMRSLGKTFKMTSGATVPPQIGYLSGLKSFVLDNFPVRATIDEFLPTETIESFAANNIQEISLRSSLLEGSIPSTLGLLTSLTSLNLQSKQEQLLVASEGYEGFVNKLSSTIPTELGLLSNLRHLYLSGNMLSGSVPKELGRKQLPFLVNFQIEDNPDLEPPIPIGFCGSDDDRLVPFESLQTDWCDNQLDCCRNA